jgi:hypothetical protein
MDLKEFCINVVKNDKSSYPNACIRSILLLRECPVDVLEHFYNDLNYKDAVIKNDFCPEHLLNDFIISNNNHFHLPVYQKDKLSEESITHLVNNNISEALEIVGAINFTKAHFDILAKSIIRDDLQDDYYDCLNLSKLIASNFFSKEMIDVYLPKFLPYYQGFTVIKAFCKNNNIATEHLDLIFDYAKNNKKLEYFNYIVSASCITEAMLKNILKITKKYSIYKDAIANKNCPSFIFKPFLKLIMRNYHSSWIKKIEVAGHKNCPVDILHELSLDRNEHVVKAVMSNPSYPKIYKVMR